MGFFNSLLQFEDPSKEILFHLLEQQTPPDKMCKYVVLVLSLYLCSIENTQYSLSCLTAICVLDNHLYVETGTIKKNHST